MKSCKTCGLLGDCPGPEDVNASYGCGLWKSMNGKSTKKSTKTSINGVRVPTFSEVTIYSAAHAFSGRVMGISNGHLHLSSDYADYYINLDNIVTVRVTRK